jgi:hypothetical protein
MKQFKDLLSEVAQPKSGEEQRFKDLHKVELIKHPVALDSQFTGEIEGVTKQKRAPDQEGDATYDPQYAVKDAPFKMPRDIDEEVEEVEEGQFWGQDKMADKSKDLTGPKTHVKLTRTKGGFQSATVPKTDKKKIAQLQKDGYKIDPTFAKESTAPKSKLTFKGLIEKVVVTGEYVEEDFDEDPISESPEYVSEDPQQEIPMMMRQLHFIAYAADEIMEDLADGDDPEEWYQNKLANTFSMMKSLYAYSAGKYAADKDEDDLAAGVYEETEVKEARAGRVGKSFSAMSGAGSMERDYIVYVDGDTKNPVAKYPTSDEAKKKRDQLKAQGKDADYKDVKRRSTLKYQDQTPDPRDKKESVEFDLNEAKIDVDYIGNDSQKASHEKRFKVKISIHGDGQAYVSGEPRDVWKFAVDHYGDQEDAADVHPGLAKSAGYQVKESLEEATFKPGNLKLKNGDSVKIQMADIKVINALMKGLNPKNRKEMEATLMKDKKGFQEILDFAKEAI